jgi:GNAT superfamily N-acetyltransferase
LLTEGYRKLSDRSRFRRYGALYTQLNSKQLDFLDHLDGIDNVAWGAFIDDGTPNGRIVGVARYVRYRAVPGSAVADVAVVVADDWQRRGVGTALLECIARLARAAGIEAFSTVVLAENDAALHLCRRYHARIGPVEEGLVEVRLDLHELVDPLG